MLVPLPIGLWIFSFVCDLFYHFGSKNPVWEQVALYTMIGGVLGALLAAIPGLVDLLNIHDPKIKQIGTFHLVLNLVAVVLFGFNAGLRCTSDPGATLPAVLSLAGILIISVSGWLGGEMVFKHGVAVAAGSEPSPEKPS